VRESPAEPGRPSNGPAGTALDPAETRRDVVLPETVAIPGGRLETRASDDEKRIVEVAAFRLGRTPVTNREFAPFVASGRAAPPPWWNDPHFSAPLQPVVGVTWDEAVGYCAWLEETADGHWRLPTEEEWEFAVCGGLAAPRTAWGETLPEGEVPEGPLSGPWEVGRGTPNGYGLYDAGTIVHEWSANWYEPDGTAPFEATPRRRAARGGSWRHKIRWSSPSARSSLPPQFRYSDFGFRVLREIDGRAEEVK
jgi:formylglycine-generating enzyme required for sulfatase activity